jgi:hypothetical protein
MSILAHPIFDPLSGTALSPPGTLLELFAMAVFAWLLLATGVALLYLWESRRASRSRRLEARSVITAFANAVAAGDFEAAEGLLKDALRLT